MTQKEKIKESVEKIFKGYNGSNRINVNFLKGISAPV
jgi:hypothetical protein